jgi:PEP-CTERM motif
MNVKLKSIVSLALFAAAAPCFATSLYFNGFESNTGDWAIASPGTITQTASGGGPLGLTSYQGADYATIQATPDGYSPGYADGGYSLFGYGSAIPAYPGAFDQQVAVYVNVNTPAPSAGTPAFWIDASPSSTSAYDIANSGGLGYGGEHNFRLVYTGTSVLVYVDGGVTPIATLTGSGWYNFESIYAQDATGVGISTATLNVLSADGTTVLGTTSLLNNSDGDPLFSQYLAGPGYEWMTVIQDGFSNNQIGIDNLRADTIAAPTPEPGSFVLLGTGLIAMAGGMRRRLFS